jgi:ribosomal protein L15
VVILPKLSGVLGGYICGTPHGGKYVRFVAREASERLPKWQVAGRWLEAWVHHGARNEQGAGNETGAGANGTRKAETSVQRVVEHDGVDHRPKGGTRCNNHHGERAAFEEVVRDNCKAGNADDACSKTEADSLRQEYLWVLVSEETPIGKQRVNLV